MAAALANGEERLGHHAAAQRLRGALFGNGKPFGRQESSTVADRMESSQTLNFLSSALTQIPADRDIKELRLGKQAINDLEEVGSEWKHRAELQAHQIARRTKLLFHGPPGCGKSVTAKALGRELGLPVFVARFDAIVGSYLGQTALHLRQVFRFSETTPSVVLVDEIDALGKRRGSPLDVGEIDRVVIALLQELEHSQPKGLLIATSNLAKQLDDALWRRFDLVVEFPRPTKPDLRSFLLASAKERNVDVTAEMRAAMSTLSSYAAVESLVKMEERRQVLRGDR